MTNRHVIEHCVRAIAPRYGISYVSLFGSYARDEQTETSDVDVLIETDEGFSLFDAIAFENDLEDALDCDVDVISRRALKGTFKKHALDEELMLYERA